MSGMVWEGKESVRGWQSREARVYLLGWSADLTPTRQTPSKAPEQRTLMAFAVVSRLGSPHIRKGISAFLPWLLRPFIRSERANVCSLAWRFISQSARRWSFAGWDPKRMQGPGGREDNEGEAKSGKRCSGVWLPQTEAKAPILAVPRNSRSSKTATGAGEVGTKKPAAGGVWQSRTHLHGNGFNHETSTGLVDGGHPQGPAARCILSESEPLPPELCGRPHEGCGRQALRGSKG